MMSKVRAARASSGVHCALALAVVISSAVALSSCGGGSSSPLQSIQISPASPDVVLNSTVQFTATGKKSDGSTTTPSVTWRTGNTAIATIDTNGLATGLAVGTTTVTATSGSVGVATTLLVSTTALQSILVSPTLAIVSVTGTSAPSSQQFTATGFFADGSAVDISNSVAWTSSDATIALVGANTGLATGFGVGTATITAASGSVTSNPATLNVIQ
jgi:uncharacterized protein YjdB